MDHAFTPRLRLARAPCPGFDELPLYASRIPGRREMVNARYEWIQTAARGAWVPESDCMAYVGYRYQHSADVYRTAGLSRAVTSRSMVRGSARPALCVPPPSAALRRTHNRLAGAASAIRCSQRDLDQRSHRPPVRVTSARQSVPAAPLRAATTRKSPAHQAPCTEWPLYN